MKFRPSNTLLLCLAMLALTAASAALSPDWKAIDGNAIAALGANFPQATFDGFGEWRLVAARLQAGSWQALALQLPFLWVVSGAVERTYGRALHALLFVALAALSSTATLALVHNERLLSVGAGGVALGFGACMLVAMAMREPGAPAWRSLLSWRALLVLPYLASTAYAVAMRQADVAALIGGMAAGGLAGLALPTLAQPRDAQARRRVTLAAAVAVVIVAAGLVAAPRPSYYWSEALAFGDIARQFGAEMQTLNKQFDGLAAEGLAGRVTPQQLAARMQAEVLPKWREAQARWSPVLDRVNPAIPDGAHLPAMKAYLASRVAFIESAIKAWTTEDPNAIAAAIKQREAQERAQASLRP